MFRVVKVKRFSIEKRGVDWRSSETLLAELRPGISKETRSCTTNIAVSEHQKVIILVPSTWTLF